MVDAAPCRQPAPLRTSRVLGVLAGFFVVWSIILVGMFVGRRNILGENARAGPQRADLLRGQPRPAL